MEITKDILYVGVHDKITDLFEGQYKIPNGILYNSYLILDEKIAVCDTVDKRFSDKWLENIQKFLGSKEPDYLIVHHMEPDHSASIDDFIKKYPDATIVSSAKAFSMMNQFFGTDFANKTIVSEGDTLSLGQKELTFITAPMVHWPEVILSYEKNTRTLFSADAFGTFGTADSTDNWESEASRYYFGIVGKYGPQVQSLLKKAAHLDIQRICPLHGPVLCDNISHYVSLYDEWSSYKSKTDTVVIAYTSVYGNTKKAVLMLEKMLCDKNINVVKYDLARDDMSKAVSDAFLYQNIVLATTTYNASVFPFMHQFINMLLERNFQNKNVYIIENSSWAPMARKTIVSMLSGCKNVEISDCAVHIKSALSEQSINELAALSQQI